MSFSSFRIALLYTCIFSLTKEFFFNVSNVLGVGSKAYTLPLSPTNLLANIVYVPTCAPISRNVSPDFKNLIKKFVRLASKRIRTDISCLLPVGKMTYCHPREFCI